MSVDPALAAESYCFYLTTTGRVTGRPVSLVIASHRGSEVAIHVLSLPKDRPNKTSNRCRQSQGLFWPIMATSENS